MRRPGERTQGRQALGWATRSRRSRGERDVVLRGARAIRQREPRGGPRGGGVLSGHRALGSVRVPWRLRGQEHARAGGRRAGGRGVAREHVRVVVQLAVGLRRQRLLQLRRQRLLQLRRMMRRQGQLRGLRRLGLRLRLRLWRRQLRAHRAGAAPLRVAQAARVAQRQAAAPLGRLSRAWVRKTGRRCGRRSGCLTRAPEAEARAHGTRWGPTAWQGAGAGWRRGGALRACCRAASDALPVARALQVRRGECTLLALELAPGPAAPLRPAALIAAQAVIARERVIRRDGQRLPGSGSGCLGPGSDQGQGEAPSRDLALLRALGPGPSSASVRTVHMACTGGQRTSRPQEKW